MGESPGLQEDWMLIKIRYNTEKDKTDSHLPAWRLLLDGKEVLAESIIIEAKSWTTVDDVGQGLIKWHITCEGTPVWDAEKRQCTIKA